MNHANGTYKNGLVILDDNADFPDGSRVRVEPVGEEESLGMREEDWPDTPEAIEEWLKWYDSLEPLIMTPEEEAAWQSARAEQKAFEKSKFEERGKRIAEMFE